MIPNNADTDQGGDFIHLNTIRLHVVQRGTIDGDLLVLLHGFPEFWYGWRHQIEPFSEAGYWVVVPDQRGYNLSDKPQGVHSYHIDLLARDVLDLIHVLGRERAFVVGHDWGAAVAWHLATYHPNVVEKLVILNVPHPQVMLRILRRNLRQLLKSWYIYFFQIPRFPEWLLSRNRFAAMRRMLHASTRPGIFSQPELEYYVEAWSQPGALTAMLNWYRSAARMGLSQMRQVTPLPSISVPTLMLWGVRDVALDRSMAQPSIDLCTQGHLVFFEDATHWVHHENSDQVNNIILGFFQS